MDTNSTTPSTNSKPPSLYSTTSSVTLIPDQPPTDTTLATTTSSELPRYTRITPTGVPPNPSAQPKPKSALTKLFGKLQSPAVKQSVAARERELLEEERTGLKKTTFGGAASDAGPATAAHYAWSGSGPGLV